MSRRIVTVVAAIGLLGMFVTSTGCSDKKAVKSFCTRLNKCQDEFLGALIKKQGMPSSPEMIKMVKEQMKKDKNSAWMFDVEKCKAKGDDLEDEAKKCIKKKDCKAFAECVINAVK